MTRAHLMMSRAGPDPSPARAPLPPSIKPDDAHRHDEPTAGQRARARALRTIKALWTTPDSPARSAGLAHYARMAGSHHDVWRGDDHPSW